MYKNVAKAIVINKRYRIILYHTMNGNLNLYKYFFAVIEVRSVVKAAAQLGVSQPPVSYSIHTLQRELGEQLFVVERQGIIPLPRAMVLYRRLKPVYLHLVQAIDGFIQNID